MDLKKMDTAYAFTWFGALAALLLVVIAATIITGNPLVLVGGCMLFVIVTPVVFKILKKNWMKNADELEKTFANTGFNYQYKFTSNSGIFYIDQGGRLGIIWKYNPTQLQLADLSQLSDIRTHDGKQLMGTALVSCQFTLAGKRYKIYTLRVSNGQLPMNSPKVIEAIAKANDLCKMIATAQQNALSRMSA